MAANTWSTAFLSVARQYLSATSLPNHGVAIIAGGYSEFLNVYFVAAVWFALRKVLLEQGGGLR